MKIEWKKWLFSGLLLAAVAVLGVDISAKETALQSEIAENVLRLHIRADSNSPEDQHLKLVLRDVLLEKMKIYESEIDSVASARRVVSEHMTEWTGCLEKTADSMGSAARVSMSVGRAWFPRKNYGDIVLPEGEYESVIVKIGSGSGRNWWCVLFPQLCFISPEKGCVTEDGKEKLAEELSEEACDKITDTRVEAKLKIVEWIKGFF